MPDNMSTISSSNFIVSPSQMMIWSTASTLTPIGSKAVLSMSDYKDSKHIKSGDWVRVICNDIGAPSPNNEGAPLLPYEGIKVIKIENRNGPDGTYCDLVIYKMGRSNSLIPLTNVEKIETCICAQPVLKACGCKCGYKQMIDDAEQGKTKKTIKAKTIELID